MRQPDTAKQRPGFPTRRVGRRLNNGVLRYMVSDLRGPIGVPQVAVVHREFVEREDGSVHRSSEIVLQRYFGLAGIREAAERLLVPGPPRPADLRR